MMVGLDGMAFDQWTDTRQVVERDRRRPGAADGRRTPSVIGGRVSFVSGASASWPGAASRIGAAVAVLAA